jgi:hypothetical protein
MVYACVGLTPPRHIQLDASAGDHDEGDAEEIQEAALLDQTPKDVASVDIETWSTRKKH